MDVHNKETRSYNMSRIKGKNTKPEELVRKYLFHNGFRYNKNYKGLPGTPDIVLHKYKTVIFINGCFWHMHDSCKYFVWPKTNEKFWKDKINQNVQRDLKNYKLLMDTGWDVIVIWECELKKEKREKTLSELIRKIR